MAETSSDEIFNYGKKRNNLLDNLKKIREYAQELDLQEVAEVINNSLKIESGFKVGVVGEFKRGKSTLINALLGENVLPADVIPCTATVNRISYGLIPAVKIIFKEKDGKPSRIEEIEFDKLREYVTKLTEESANRASDIKEALIEYNVNYLQHDVDIIDTPGLNDADDMTEITVGLLDRTHAAIMVVAPDAPFGMSEMQFLEEMSDKSVGRVLFVVNRIDVIDEDDRSRLLDAIRQRIISAIGLVAERRYGKDTEEYQNHIKRFGEPKLFPVSAKKALKGKLTNNQALIEESGFIKFEEALKKFLTKDSGSVIIASLSHCVKNNADKILTQTQIKESGLRASNEDFNKTYDTSMETLKDLSQKYDSQIGKIREATERTKGYARGILDKLEDNLVVAIVNTIENETIEVSHISKNKVAETQRKIGDKIEKAARAVLLSTLSDIEVGVGRELEIISEKLQLFGEEVVTSLNQIQADFLSLTPEIQTDEATAGDMAKGAAVSYVTPLLGGIYTGYKEGKWKGAILGGGAGFVAGGATAFGLGMVVGALGLAITAPVILPIVIVSCVASAVAGKFAVRAFFGGERVSTFKDNFKNESVKLLKTEFAKNRRELENEINGSVEKNFQNLERLVESEVGKLIAQTQKTIEDLNTKKARSETEIIIELEKLSKIREHVLMSRNHAETTLGELQKIEGV